MESDPIKAMKIGIYEERSVSVYKIRVSFYT